MKIAVIVDNLRVAEWQQRALASIAHEHEFVIYNCCNTRPAKRKTKHAAYYCLNLFAVRNQLTKSCFYGLESATIHHFESEYSGRWQRLPPEILRSVAREQATVVIKFGMGLLEIPPQDQLPAVILSYHHGDPAQYRGRPAGFYELLHGRAAMGQIVQQLSNELDAGKIVAFAETKVFPHSYRATLIDAYGKSPLLLKIALDNVAGRRSLERDSAGPLYRLPSTRTVLRLILKTTAARLGRWLYGAFKEKSWRVSTAPMSISQLLRDGAGLSDQAKCKAWPVPSEYSFLADPFFSPGGDTLLVEALRSTTGIGEILEIGPRTHRRLSDGNRHFSYPATFTEEGTNFLIPEVSEWSSPLIFAYSPGGLVKAGELNIAGAPRLLDPTIVRHGCNLFLFANRADEGPGVLRLWHSKRLFDRFNEHPFSPLRISPNGSRMAGNIVSAAEGMFRFGQRWEEHYGDGIMIFRIHDLSTATYSETVEREVRLSGLRGPHTLNFSGSEAAFDWYCDRLTPFAGVRRLLGSSHRRLSHEKIG